MKKITVLAVLSVCSVVAFADLGEFKQLEREIDRVNSASYILDNSNTNIGNSDVEYAKSEKERVSSASYILDNSNTNIGNSDVEYAKSETKRIRSARYILDNRNSNIGNQDVEYSKIQVNRHTMGDGSDIGYSF